MKIFTSATFFLTIILLISCSQGERKTTIGYIQITRDEVLDTAKAGVLEALRDSGYIPGGNIKFIDNNAEGDLSMIPTILQSFKSQNVDMIITNSTPCMVAATQMISDIPVVFTVSFGPEQIGVKNIPPNIYGIYDPLDTKEYVSMMQECMPSLKKVGLPYNNAEPNAEYSAKKFKEEFSKRGITVITATVNNVNDLPMVGKYLAGQNPDAILVAADNTVYMGLSVLVKTSEDSKIPLFVTDPHQALKGATVGMGVNYHQWGYLSGLKAVEILNRRLIVNRIEELEKEEILFNSEKCKKYGIIKSNRLNEFNIKEF